MIYLVFLRRPGTALAIAALALLVAPLASLTSVVNHVGSQVETMAGLVRVGRAYLVLNASSRGLADSRLDAGVVGLISSVGGIERVFPQRLAEARLDAGPASVGARVREVGGLGDYLRLYGASVRGSLPRGIGEACVGEVLARAAGVDVGDAVTISVGAEATRLTVVCVHRARSALDAEVLVQLEGAEGRELSVVELVLGRGVSEAEVLGRLRAALPGNLRVVRAQQLEQFLSDVSSQTLALLGIWSPVVYAAVFASSLVVAARLVAESEREISTLRALGAGRGHVAASLLTYVALVSSTGAALGVAAGLVGAQVVSTVLRWAGLGVELSPHLRPGQAAIMILLALASSLLGSLHPVLSSTRERRVEQFREVWGLEPG